MTVCVNNNKRLRKAHKYDLLVRPKKKQQQYLILDWKQEHWDRINGKIVQLDFKHTIFGKILRINKRDDGSIRSVNVDIILNERSPANRTGHGSLFLGRTKYYDYEIENKCGKICDADALPLKYFMKLLACSITI